ncbi:spore coat polysaccharide synthesis (glucose-1-phosphate thymidyltransferase) [Oceanobacillus iheyensis HTE831]|uniref:Glucose-1-phosphate thymidylyltransferase n=1 Tax=Oceanobacillus iheyensis (strain DSM 14371 / CIP 107618 / JCM 11309 / KCTC 3954 / HTE831) TaxID=221109 RepID=Q8CUH8_OCEIH|nr:sugar phosphate nucleotidyltransferase [Oceanobacillus iheyensis]BAC13085.1 spore coat polysaccharide synthesis (glucose-1-phosphate thymidyltransferase) [Oceanobacillus iheyensis HTE831]
MKGMILARGKGTRLHPLTKVINKHLIPIGKYPMIYYPIFKLREVDITEILITTNQQDIPLFRELLGDGRDLGVRIHFEAQQQAIGIPDAILLSKTFVGSDKLTVILGDNIFHDSLIPYVQSYEKQSTGAKILLKTVSDPNRYGIATFDKSQKNILSIEEKPSDSSSNYCVTGIYMYGTEVFEFIKQITPSSRGELEITDVNNLYLQKSKLTFDVLPNWWIDAGTYDSIFQANQIILKNE